MKWGRSGRIEGEDRDSLTPSPATPDAAPMLPRCPLTTNPPASAYSVSTCMSPASSTQTFTPAVSTRRPPTVDRPAFTTRDPRRESRSSPCPLSLAVADTTVESGSSPNQSESRKSATETVT